MCQCGSDVKMGNYRNQVVLRLPKHYVGQKVWAGIDRCIADEIIKLWNEGITTLGSCCGHNQIKGTICVDDLDIEKMQKLGYKWFKNPDGRMEIFYNKTF